MNIGLAPMPEGMLHQNDVETLAAFGRKVKQTFADNLVKGASVKASSKRGTKSEFNVKNIIDDDRYSYYASKDGVLQPTIQVSLAGEKEFDIIRLRENIKLGQRLDSVVVEVFQGRSWKRLASATSIGANRLIKLANPMKASKLRIRLYAPVVPTLSDFGLFKEYEEAFQFGQTGQGQIKLEKAAFTLQSPVLGQATDGNSHTIAQLANPHEGIVLELNEPISALGYLPRQDEQKEGMALKYAIYTGVNTGNGHIDWTESRTGEFSNIQANPTEQIISFDKKVSAKYIRFVPTEVVGKGFTVAEFNCYR